MIYMYVQKPLLCGQWRKSRYKINIIHQKSNNHLPKNHGIYCEINGIWPVQKLSLLIFPDAVRGNDLMIYISFGI